MKRTIGTIIPGKRIITVLSLVALCCTLYLRSLPVNAAVPEELLREFPRAQLIVVGNAKCIQFDIYIAQTGPQRTQGLMHIRSMELHEGMLFVYAQATRISMWMKNTLIPLDMLFFDESGQIVTMHENATPLSTDIIDSNAVVAGVVELNGGAAEKLAIGPGSRIMLFQGLRI